MSMFRRVTPNEQQANLAVELESKFRELEAIFSSIPQGRLKAIALTNLEAAALFATKAVMHDG